MEGAVAVTVATTSYLVATPVLSAICAGVPDSNVIAIIIIAFVCIVMSYIIGRSVKGAD